LSEAEYMLGESYRKGTGVKRDSTSALSWYLKAAKKGNSDAQLMSSVLYLSGEAWRKELVKSFIWAEIALQNGNEEASKIIKKLEKKISKEDRFKASRDALRCIKSKYKNCPY